jgi:hypothetical protein
LFYPSRKYYTLIKLSYDTLTDSSFNRAVTQGLKAVLEGGMSIVTLVKAQEESIVLE